MEQSRQRNIIDPLPGYVSEIGRWLWAIEDERRKTLSVIENLSLDVLDSQPASSANTIGVLLYHLAAVEASWVYEDVLEQDIPTELGQFFPHNSLDEQGLLTRLHGSTIDTYLQRLQVVRGKLLEVYEGMSLDDFRRVRRLPDYDATPEWVLHHLIQHEAEHRGHIEIIVEGFKAR